MKQILLVLTSEFHILCISTDQFLSGSSCPFVDESLMIICMCEWHKYDEKNYEKAKRNISSFDFKYAYMLQFVVQILNPYLTSSNVNIMP